MAMPLTGFEDEPSSPVMREETTEKKKPKTMMATAERTRDPEPGHRLELGQEGHEEGEGERAAEDDRDRQVALGAPLLPRAAPPAASCRSRNDARKLSMMVGMRLHEVDDAARRHRPRADVADVAAPDVERLHLVDGHGGRVERRRRGPRRTARWRG